MKKIFLLILLCISVGCNKEQKELEACQEALLGKWGFWLIAELTETDLEIYYEEGDFSFFYKKIN